MNGDVIISPSNDLVGKSGIDLINQRISIRLRLHRGEWLYDENDSLGSQLYRLIGVDPARASQLAPAYVREALRGMEDEIQVDDVHVVYDAHSITLSVIYRVLNDSNGAAEGTAEQVEISIPFGGNV